MAERDAQGMPQDDREMPVDPAQDGSMDIREEERRHAGAQALGDMAAPRNPAVGTDEGGGPAAGDLNSGNARSGQRVGTGDQEREGKQ